MRKIIKTSAIILLVVFAVSCGQPAEKAKKESAEKKEIKESKTMNEATTWAERLGYGKGKKVLILHADDAGMCTEANKAVEKYLTNGDIKSTSVMMPCPAAEEMIAWAVKHPGHDVGIHLTLTSEWKTYRWGPVSDPSKVPGLIDPDGKFWHEVPGVVQHASAKEVETEIRAQIDKSKSLGWEPTHLDSHMGTLFGSPEYLMVFLKVSEEYGIPAAIVDISKPKVFEFYKKQGYPFTEEAIKWINDYKMPKLDFYSYVPKGKSYDEVKQNFFGMVNSLDPGLVQVFFHPSVFSERLKTITNSWQQRVWEAQLFSDPEVKKFLNDNGIIVTNWIDVFARYKK